MRTKKSLKLLTVFAIAMQSTIIGFAQEGNMETATAMDYSGPNGNEMYQETNSETFDSHAVTAALPKPLEKRPEAKAAPKTTKRRKVQRGDFRKSIANAAKATETYRVLGEDRGVLVLGNTGANRSPGSSFGKIDFFHGGTYNTTFASIFAARAGLNKTGKLYFQTRDGGNLETRMVITENGNVGIGRSAPGVRLDVNGSVRSKAGYRVGESSFNKDQGGALELRGENASSTPYIDFTRSGSGDRDARLYLRNREQLVLDGSKLILRDGFIAKSGIIKLNVFADFVFDKDYDLPTLEEVEDYINKEGHLSEIPSEAEVLANGLDMGMMDVKLLQKVEELTLYMIELNKQVKTLQKENQELKKTLKQ